MCVERTLVVDVLLVREWVLARRCAERWIDGWMDRWVGGAMGGGSAAAGQH